MEEKRARGGEEAQTKLAIGDPAVSSLTEVSEPAQKKGKVGPSMDPVEPAAQKKLTVVYFRHGLSNPCFRSVQLLKHKFDEFGKVADGPTPLSIPNDFAFLIYETQEEAHKAVQGCGEFVCFDTDDAILEAVRQTVLDKVRPLLAQAPPHPSSNVTYVSNLHYKSTPDDLKAFFSQYGEIAHGPIIFELEEEIDMLSCIIIYKTEEGAKEAIREPNKNFKQFKGYQLHCSADIENIVRLNQSRLREDVMFYLEITEGKMHTVKKCTTAEQFPKQASALDDVVAAAGRLNDPKLASALNGVVAAAERLNKAADLAMAAAERFNLATSGANSA